MFFYFFSLLDVFCSVKQHQALNNVKLCALRQTQEPFDLPLLKQIFLLLSAQYKAFRDSLIPVEFFFLTHCSPSTVVNAGKINAR